MIAQGHGRVVVEVIGLGPGPTRIRWLAALDMPRRTCETVTFLEHSEKVCAPRARLGVRAIAGRSDSYASGAYRAGPQLGTTWNTVVPYQAVCQAASGDRPLRRGAGAGVDGMCGIAGPTRRGPREFTGIVDHSREDHPQPLVGPGPGRSGTVYRTLVGQARKTSVRGANRDAGSLPGI